MGHASTFVSACGIVIVWAAAGPLFHFSDTWQLVINTGTTIVTFLMVFLLQHAQNRDSTAIQLKLDELIRVNRDARNKLLALAGTVGVDLEEAREDLQEARQGIEQAQSAIARAKVVGAG